jgi:hypothetical protein
MAISWFGMVVDDVIFRLVAGVDGPERDEERE